MPGLDPEIIEQIDPEITLERIKNDLKTDFIFSPHYAAIFEHVGDELWEQLHSNLRSGNFEPELPITVEVPKPNELTRPGSILKPADRFIYQALIDVIAPIAEPRIDRSRAFSNVLLNPDPECRMFEASHICWDRLQESIRRNCENGRWTHAIRADVANFFERLYQHVLINLLHSSNCPSGAVNLLGQLLSSWMEKDSHGILQGMFPSDFLGNFYLVGLDSNLEVAGVPSSRFVDDLYIFYPSRPDAKRGLVELCRSLRSEGLHLNERKSSVLEVHQLLHEETMIDRMFNEARDEIEEEISFPSLYGFQSGEYEDEEEEQEDEEEEYDEQIELRVVESLYQNVEDSEAQADSIELFCLPFLALAGSEIGVPRAIEGILQRPHLAKHYCSYLAKLIRQNSGIGDQLEEIIREGGFSYDWQQMWPIVALLNKENVESNTVTFVIRLLCDRSLSVELRAICAIFIGKHGTPGQRRILIQQYSNEPSDYVQGAILFTSQYFPSAQRRAYLSAWGRRSKINALIARAVQKIVQ